MVVLVERRYLGQLRYPDTEEYSVHYARFTRIALKKGITKYSYFTYWVT